MYWLVFFTLFNENRLENLQNSTNHEPGKILSMEAAKRVSEAHQLSREIKKIIISISIIKSLTAMKKLAPLIYRTFKVLLRSWWGTPLLKFFVSKPSTAFGVDISLARLYGQVEGRGASHDINTR